MIVSSLSGNYVNELALPLERYAQLVNYDECAFFNVRKDGQSVNDCSGLLTEYQRQNIQLGISSAVSEIEKYLGYFLVPRYVVGKLSDEPNSNSDFVDKQSFLNPGTTRYKNLIEFGQEASTLISDGEVVDHTSDPAVIGPIAVSFTDVSEVVVTHPGSDRRINPSAITISGGNLTINIPRCRLVKQALKTPSQAPLQYTELTNFESSVDVYRFYNDPSVNAELVREHTCSSSCFSNGCSEYTRTACVYIEDNRLGRIHVTPATYSDGTWSKVTDSCCYNSARYYYRSGLTTMNPALEEAIIRLAHTNMPSTPCACDTVQRAWVEDRTLPPFISKNRERCPFGLTNGAWRAWTLVNTFRIRKMSMV